MDLRKKPMYLSGSSRPMRRRRSGANAGSLLFIGLLVGVNYFVFLKDDAPQNAPPVEQRIRDQAESGATAHDAPNGNTDATQGPAAPTAAPGVGIPGVGLPWLHSHATRPAGANTGLSEASTSDGIRPSSAAEPSTPPPPPAGVGNLPTPAPSAPAPGSPKQHIGPPNPLEEEEGAVLAGSLERGQTLLQALGKQGVEAPAMYGVIAEMEKVFDFRHARVGDRYALVIDGRGKIKRFQYETSPLDRYEVERNAEGAFGAVKKAVTLDVHTAEIGCALRSSLYASVKRCGEDPQLASKVVDLFAWDVDFFQDVRDGDRFKLIVEKQFVDGQFLSYGRVLAAEYEGAAGSHRVVWFEQPEAGIAGYYKTDGQAARKEFLKTPLKYTRISSGYTHHRYNPVLHRYKKHLGIDYTAPEGSPVWAVSSGTVTFVGEKGGSGNLVAIRHANGYTSFYAHLQGFSEGLAVGDQVSQKEVIGYVGSTGRTAGPQLYFALKHRDRFVDPQKIKFTSDSPVPAELLPAFLDTVRTHEKALDAIPVIGPDQERS